MKKPNFRPAILEDAGNIAAIHVMNWQDSYRGMWTDHFLDKIAPIRQPAVWTKELSEPNPKTQILAATLEGELAGFICTRLEDDPVHGTLIDNLHVHPNFRKKGIGKSLIKLAADWVEEKTPGSPIYLWVLEENHPARRFYKNLGGKETEVVTDENPEMGTYRMVRCVWTDSKQIV